MTDLKVLSLFSGIGAFEKALKRLKKPYRLVGYSEIDKYASKGYSLIHSVSESLNMGDIRNVDVNSIEDFNLLTFGFPCQAISVAGKQKGIRIECKDCEHEFPLSEELIEDDYKCPECKSIHLKGYTESGLFFDGLQVLKKKQPEYCVIENVKNLVQGKFKETFDLILKSLDYAGYDNFWAVLNSKEYGVPQNRERVFIISIRKDLEKEYVFPEGFESSIRLKDVLEEEVDPKYYMSEDKSERLISYFKEQINESNPKFTNMLEYYEPTDNEISKVFDIPKSIVNDNERQRRVYSPEGIAPTVLARSDTAKIMLVGYLDMKAGKQIRSVYSSSGLAPTIDTMQGGHRQPKVLIPLNKTFITEDDLKELGLMVRKLTPLESFRLMGFDDEDYHLLREHKFSDTRLYKAAGNSIVVDVLEHLLGNLFE